MARGDPRDRGNDPAPDPHLPVPVNPRVMAGAGLGACGYGMRGSRVYDGIPRVFRREFIFRMAEHSDVYIA